MVACGVLELADVTFNRANEALRQPILARLQRSGNAASKANMVEGSDSDYGGAERVLLDHRRDADEAPG